MDGAKLGDERRRIVRITEGNLRNSHIYVKGLEDFLPADIVGGSTRTKRGGGIQLDIDGLQESVSTDVGSDSKTGQSRGFLRGRNWVRRFFEHHNVTPGSDVAFDRLSERRYRLSVVNGKPLSLPGRRVVEFFAGIGLVRLGLERHGWEVVFANDIDAAKAEMYRQNWTSNDHLLVGDIHQIDVRNIPNCDLFTASFPCNDLSIAGRWEGLSGKESSAFWGVIRILKEMGNRRPQAVLLENVVGFLQSRGGQDFAIALAALNDLGYSVDAFILNAACWVPQSRARLFVVADQENSRQGTEFALQSDARPEALVRFVAKHPEIRWNFRTLPPLPTSVHQLRDILEDLPPNDERWWSQDRADYFMNQLSPRHEAAAQKMIARRTYSYATAFRRVRNGRSMAELRIDGIAGCLRTPRGGSGRQILLKAGNGKYQVRLLTPRECARLQGVPDTYKIEVSPNQALFGFGDAVCVPAIEWIAEYHLR